MANLISAANGNFTSAGTWQVADTTSASIANTTNTSVTTSPLDSASFIPGAITIDGISLNFFTKSGSSGTFTVTLRNTTISTDVGTVTVNVSDLPSDNITSTVNNSSWQFFKFSSPITLTAGQSYVVRLSSSVASQVRFLAGASNNWNRMLRTTTTQAPAAADRLFIGREYTGIAASTTRTVTMDNNNTTSFGEVDIGSGGVLTYVTSADTQLRLSGNMVISASGELDIGVSGTPINSANTAILDFNCTSNGQYGLAVFGIWKGEGANKNFSKSKLAANVSVGATSLTLADSVGSGWKSGDTLVITSTAAFSSLPSESEFVTATADGVGSTIAISATSFSHTGTAPVQGTVGNITRNAKVKSATSFTSYIYAFDPAVVTLNWVEVSKIGTATSPFQGFTAGTVSGSVTVTKSSIHDSPVASSLMFKFDAASNNCSIDDSVLCDVSSSTNCAQIDGGSNNTINNCLVVGILGTGIFCRSLSNIVTNNTCAGCVNGIQVQASSIFTIGTYSGNTTHGNISGLRIGAQAVGTISNHISWKNTVNAAFNSITSGANTLILDNYTAFSAIVSGINFSGSWPQNTIIQNSTFNGGTSPVQPAGVSFAASIIVPNLQFINCTFGATTAHGTADFQNSGAATTPPSVNLVLRNCLLASTTELSGQTILSPNASIRSSRHDQVSGDYKTFYNTGTITKDTTILFSSTQTERLTPLSATLKLESSQKSAALVSGQKVTVTVKTRKGTGYNGNNQRLILKAYNGAGYATDTILATATSAIGTIDTLTAQIPTAVTENCVLQFIVDCDGTAGFVNVGDWSITIP